MSTLYLIIYIILQHEFVRGCTDARPIRELIAEFKADVIEEEEKLNAEEELKVPLIIFGCSSLEMYIAEKLGAFKDLF